jgi:hypothetical protein
LTASDLLAALEPVIDVLEALGVPHFVGGSLASSAHGIPRASIDADVVADLGPAHVAPLVGRLQGRYYLDEAHIRAAVAARRSFNLIHLDTLFKIDVFASKRRPFDLEALRRARPQPLEDAPQPRPFRVATPEDTILAKLEWFRAGGETSERQWTDVVGVIKARSDDLDVPYLRRWAASLGVGDLLDRALTEASGPVR